MKWQVRFKEKKRSCCPPAYYYAIIDSVVVADTEQEVLNKLKKGRIAVEVQKIKPYE
jgi:hypothetical protein